MKKIIALVIIAALLCVVLAGCGSENYVAIAPDANYKTAIICFPNGEVITISVGVYTYSTNSDRVIIKCTDGTCYITAWQNVILIGESIDE